MQQILVQFDTFNDAPNGIQKLRELILQLAVQGKLVPQNPSDLPAPQSGKFWVYVIKCSNDSNYIGQTNNLRKRWDEHKSGTGADWTKKYKPQYMMYWEECNSREEAVNREKWLKTGFGRKWIKREEKAGRLRRAGEPASELLKKIKAEKEKLIGEGKIKKHKKLPLISDEEIPYELPEGWEWARVEEVTFLKSGNTVSPDKLSKCGKIPYIKVSDMNLQANHKFIKTSINYVDISYNNENKIIPKNSIIFPKRGGAIATNKKRILFKDIYADSNIMAMCIILQTTLSYFNLWFKSIDLWTLNTGTSVPQINNKDIYPLLIPLPPLPEQHRIVKKVDELMALCDQLEAAKENRDKAQLSAGKAALHQLMASDNQEIFQQNWQRVVENFDTLTNVKENVAELKKAILQLAVQGKLVPQDSSDESAEILLKKIKAEKERLTAEGKIKRQKKLPPISADEVPYALPEGWVWTRLGEINEKIHYGYTASADVNEKKYRLLRITDIQKDKVNWKTVPGCKISENDVVKFLLKDNDILIARTGGTIGKSYIVENVSVKSVFASYLIRLVPIDLNFPKYIKYFLGSQLYWKQLTNNSMGTGQPNVNATALSSLLFPLPPFPEQHRIVEKVDQLMAICDSLEQGIESRESVAEKLVNALVTEV